MELVLDQLDANPADYPSARVPLLPPLAPQPRLADAERIRPLSRFTAADALFVRTGRAALAMAMRALELAPGQRVLVPAYHCASMLTPILHFGAEPVYYRLHDDLSPDLDDLRRRLGPEVRACILPHYFGIPQTSVVALSELCRAAGVALVEDCAHAFFGEVDGRPVGAYGDFAIASSRKFFPGKDGGFLVSNRADLPVPSGLDHSLVVDLRNLFDSLQLASRAGHWPWLRPLFRVLEARPRRKAPAPPCAPVSVSVAAAREFAITPADLRTAGTRVSRAIIRHSDHALMAAARRNNYRFWLDAIARLPGIRPLFPDLPASAVPYVFPVVVDAPERIFPVLKNLGFPIYRWEYLGPSDCAVSRGYGLSLWQLPCQQLLTDTERTWLFDTLRTILEREWH